MELRCGRRYKRRPTSTLSPILSISGSTSAKHGAVDDVECRRDFISRLRSTLRATGKRIPARQQPWPRRPPSGRPWPGFAVRWNIGCIRRRRTSQRIALGGQQTLARYIGQRRAAIKSLAALIDVLAVNHTAWARSGCETTYSVRGPSEARTGRHILSSRRRPRSGRFAQIRPAGCRRAVSPLSRGMVG